MRVNIHRLSCARVGAGDIASDFLSMAIQCSIHAIRTRFLLPFVNVRLPDWIALIENDVNLSIYVRDACSGITCDFLLMRLSIIFIGDERSLPAAVGCAAAKGVVVRGGPLVA
ncbi:hypothetical protein QF001_003372 [Paraburkholderia youngii]|uniref:hypothetical protein n=1 Tax=Paraburkholderia youngii TaxID=2782701 RepID=UPI003D221646